MEEIIICIGTEEKTKIALAVLKYSILKRTKNPIKFIEMEGESWIRMKDKKLGVGTGFSLRRWTIPENLNHEGFAIYLDVDQIVLADIQELWNQNIGKTPSSIYCTYQPDKFFGNAPNTSVMLIDCERAKKDWWTYNQVVKQLEIDCPNRKAYIDIMHAKHITPPPTKIAVDWNCLNIPTPNCKLLHYTTEHQQPWYFPKHPYAFIWKEELINCVKDGFLNKTDIQEACQIFKPATRVERAMGVHPYWLKWVK